MSALGHAGLLARVEIVRMVRTHTDRSRGVGAFLSLAVFLLVLAVTTVGGGYLAYRLGGSLAAGEVDLGGIEPIAVARGLVAVVGLIVTAIVVLRAVGQRGTLTGAEGVLTIVPTREAFVGILVSETVFLLLWLGGPAVGIGVGLAVGTGSPASVVAVPLAFVATGATAVAVGYPLGVAIRHLVTRFPFVVRNKAVLIVAAFVVYFGIVATGTLDAVVVALFEPLQASPTGWFADLLLLGTPAVGATALRAAGSVGVAAVVAVAAVVVGTRVADRHWFSDPALAGEEPKTPTESAAPGVERRLAPLFGTATAALVALAWRRALRAPMKLLYAAYPLLLAIGVLADIVQSGAVPAYLPFGTLVFVAWAAGVIFTLNPLGDQGAALPTTVLSRVDGSRFVRAHLLASLLVAVPLGVAVTAAVAVLSPLETATAVGLVAAVAPVMVLSSGLSVGIGMAFPRFEAVNVTRSLKTVVPSMLAFLIFSLHLVLTITAGAVVAEEGARTVLAALVSLVPLVPDVDPGTLYAIAAVALVPLVAAPFASYRYAVNRFDGYTLE